MVRNRWALVVIVLLAVILAGCKDSPIDLYVDGSTLVKPGNQVVLTAVTIEDATLKWSLSNPDMGILAVPTANPNQAIFTANPGVSGKVKVTVTDFVNSKSVELLITDLTIAGERGWNFARQGGGEVQSPDDRGYGPNTVISHWNYGGHWLEWDINIPKADEYVLIIRYATKRDPHLTKRELKIGGETVIPVMMFKNTHGYAGPLEGSSVAEVSQWDTAVFPGIYLEKGMQAIRLTHIGDEPTGSNGTNVAYIAFISPDILEITDDILLIIENQIGVQREPRHW